MLNDETTVSTSIESACLPIGCAVSAKYRGAFCSAEVKTVERQVKLKVTLFDTGNTIVISEDEIVHPIPLRIGNTVLIHTSNSAHTRNGLPTLVNSNDNHSKQRGTIKQIYDNSIYTVVFNDGDEKSLRRSSLCLQGIRLYQTKIGQQKILEDIPTSSKVSKDENDIASIVAVRRRGNTSQNQQVFPALILNRKSLADYIWVRSFLDGREYIVHKRDDVESYQNNSRVQSLCRLTSKQATKACEKFIKYNQIPLIWQKKKKNNQQQQHHNEREDNSDSNTSDPDVDDSDEETSEEKDSFVAQLFAFMDDRGTPINNIPKVHNCDLDLHRLFKVVRMFGGYNKVTKNDQWNRVYKKMGLPDEASPKNSRAIELAYKKYLFGYEDLSKKLGTMNAPNAYFGGRTSMSSDSRRSLIRVRQQSEEKRAIPTKQQARKRLSVDSKPTFSSTKPQSTTSRRKTIIIKPRSSTSDSDSSDAESISTSKKRPTLNSKKLITDEKKKANGTKNASSTSLNPSRANSAPVRKSKSVAERENTLKPVIKIPKISCDILMESTVTNQKGSKKQSTKNQDNLSTDQRHKGRTRSESQTNDVKSSKLHQSNVDSSIKNLDVTPLKVTPVSPSPPSSTNAESPSNHVSSEIPSPVHESTNDAAILLSISHKRSCDHQSIDDGLFPSKRSRLSQDSLDRTNLRSPRLTYEDISINDFVLVKCNLKEKKEQSGQCLEKNNENKELLIRYPGLDSTYDEWIEIDRVICRQNESEMRSHRTSIEDNPSNEPDNGIWKDLLADNVPNLTNENPSSITPEMNSESMLHTSDRDFSPMKEEILDHSPLTSLAHELTTSVSMPSSPSDHRRTSIRRQKRRTFPTPKDSSNVFKKRLRLDFDQNSNFNLESIPHSDNSSIFNEQQSIENKRCRTVGKRTIKRTDNEMENSRANSPVNGTLRQQLEDMFKQRASRYNFLDLNDNLTGDRRLVHLKDQMRQCQRVFFNLKHALTKIEKQRKLFLRRQKLSIVQPTTTDLFLPSTCT